MNQLAPVIEIPPNPAGGRDLVFGDIHGCFGTVEHALEALDYDASRDRLFSLGDLIDHGTRSAEAFEWIQSRFTTVVRGNHEQMMLEWLWRGAQMHTDGGYWREHWSSWWFPMNQPREVRLAWFNTLRRLPFAATVYTTNGKRVGLVHGQPYDGPAVDWSTACRRIEQPQRRNDPVTPNDHAYSALWTRSKMRLETPDETLPIGITQIELMLHGHDAGTVAVWTAQRALCIDTGVHWPELGHLTIAEIQTGRPALHRFARAHTDTLLEPPPRPAGLWDHGQGLNREAFIAAMGTTEHPAPLAIEYQAGRVTL